MFALFLFEIIEEDADESAAAVVEDIEVLTALDKAAVAAEALTAAALRAALIFFLFVHYRLTQKKG